ncbi:MAG: hypothetical protein LBB83_09130, partial [Treponema sp.]|nr:hypothetical protein [Treponema sp.]
MNSRTVIEKALFMLLLFSLPFMAETQEPADGSENAARPNRGPEGAGQDAMYAREEFRLGVQAYNRFS